MTPENAMRQAAMTAAEYADRTLDDLLKALDIQRDGKGEWREKVAPFAAVWAAMITASASDFDVAERHGAIGPGPFGS